MKNNKITIHDLAKILNIDSSTVSRALNNSPRVTIKTKQKIKAKADELGYKRNHLASNLRKSKTFTLGVIVPRISRHFFSSAIAGIEETAYESGYNVIICQSLDKLDREMDIVNNLLANRVDGVLMSISMETKNYKHLEDLKKIGTPFVFFDRHCDIPGNSNVIIDDYMGGFNATEHLISKGCKTIAHFAGPLGIEIYKNRFQGYKAALKKHTILYKEELVIESRLMEKDGIYNIKKVLSLPYKVDGIFTANDIVAISTMQYLKKENVKVPQDIAIVGFSNEPSSAVIEPSLTTIDQPGFKMGILATDLLLKQINNTAEREETIVLKPSLIIRNSSKKTS